MHCGGRAVAVFEKVSNVIREAIKAEGLTPAGKCNWLLVLILVLYTGGVHVVDSAKEVLNYWLGGGQLAKPIPQSFYWMVFILAILSLVVVAWVTRIDHSE